MNPFDDTTVEPQSADPNSPSPEESADCKRRLKLIEETRKFDEPARMRYALDRRIARGDSGDFVGALPIASTYIGILEAFLYARDPDLDCEPAEGTTPPPLADIMEMAADMIAADQEAGQQIVAAGEAAKDQVLAQGAQQQVASDVSMLNGDAAGMVQPPTDPIAVATIAMQTKSAELIKAKANELMAPYRKRQLEAQQLGQTMATVVSYLWRKGRLKHCAGQAVRSDLTIGIGWLKAAWQEQKGKDPIIQQEISSLQANLAQLTASEKELAEGTADDDALRASIEQQIQGLQAKVEVVIARGLGLDFVAAEDITVSLDVPVLDNYLDAGWIDHRAFMPVSEAKAKYPRIAEVIKSATVYHQQPPPSLTETRDIRPNSDIPATEADAYRTGSPIANQEGNICIHETWDKTKNMIVTTVEGLDRYAVEPYPPYPGTERFYGFFQIASMKCDGDRHPDSLIKRSQMLLADMNDTYQNRQTHRRRSVPRSMLNASSVGPEELAKITKGVTQEIIPVQTVNPEQNMQNMIVAVPYAPIDQALYDTTEQRAMLEMTWGIQEALSSSIRTAKTAHEAEIQQKGTEARTNFTADSIDTCMQELAEYSAQVALQVMTTAEVMEIAGPWAFWPEGLGIDGLHTLCKINIRAGSSGKPHTAAKQQQWATIMPILQNAILQIGQLRGSSPEQIADGLQELVAETLARTGEKMDPSRFLPGPPNAAAPPQPMAPPPEAQGPAPQPVQPPTGVTLQ